MTDDARLAAFFAISEPPRRDYAFTAEVMQRLARRKLAADIGGLSAASLVGAAILWGLWPILSPALQDLSHGLAPAAAAILTVMGLGVAVTGKAFFGLAIRT